MTNSLLSIWQTATSLDYAPSYYMDEQKEKLRSIEALMLTNKSKAREQIHKEITDPDSKERALFILNKLQGPNENEANITSLMMMFSSIFLDGKGDKWDIISKINRQELIPLGYVVPRNIDAKPVIIPTDVFDAKIKWNKNEVIGAGLHFVSVRVISKNRFNKLIHSIDISTAKTLDNTIENNESPDTHAETLTNEQIKSLSSKKAGRPTKKDTILRAFKYGISESILDMDNTKQHIYQQVREIINSNWADEYEKGKGLDNGAMGKHISKLIDANRL